MREVNTAGEVDVPGCGRTRTTGRFGFRRPAGVKQDTDVGVRP